MLKSISNQCSYFITPENIRKPLISGVSRRYEMGALAINQLILVNFNLTKTENLKLNKNLNRVCLTLFWIYVLYLAKTWYFNPLMSGGNKSMCDPFVTTRVKIKKC